MQVVHRQLMAALGKSQDYDTKPSAVVVSRAKLAPVRHAELAELADHMNETHRQAKRAQKDCSDLYLLLLLHKCVLCRWPMPQLIHLLFLILTDSSVLLPAWSWCVYITA